MNKTNKMDPFSGSKKKKAPNYNNFLEAFKDIGSSTVKSFAKDVVGGVGKSAVNVLTKGQTQSEQKPQESFNFEEYLNQQERVIKQRERQRFESIRREEQVIFSREQQQVKVQIESIQVQIQQMAKEQVGLMAEIDQAASQAIVNPGIYHQNFFERLAHLIKLARKKISESRSWLALHNHRSKSRQGYWQGVKNSGTSFMLSGERTTATQTG